jgi:hypothetical protein
VYLFYLTLIKKLFPQPKFFSTLALMPMIQAKNTKISHACVPLSGSMEFMVEWSLQEDIARYMSYLDHEIQEENVEPLSKQQLDRIRYWILDRR